MERKLLVYPLLLLTLFFILPTLAQTPNLCSYRGYANRSGTAVNTSDIITVVGANRPYNATIFSDGSYTLDVEADANANITFQIDGVNVAQGYQTFSCGATTLVTQNLSITLLSDGSSCSYSLACSGGYCCSGATQITGGAGSGTCQSSACSAGGDGGTTGGGGGGAATTTTTTTTTVPTTTTTTLPPVTEDLPVISEITPTTPATVETTNPDEVKVEKITIEVKNTVTNVRVSITRTFSQPATVSISAATETDEKVYTYLEVDKTNIQDEDISSVRIRFKVEKSWLSENNIDASTVTLKRYENGAWSSLPTIKATENDDFVFYEAVSPGLSVFAVSAKQLPPTTTTTTTTVPTTTTTKPIVAPEKRNIFVIIIVLALIVAGLFWVYREKLKTPWGTYR